MLKKISLLMALVLLLSVILITHSCAQPNYSKNELEEIMLNCQIKKDNAHAMAEAARGLGYSNDHSIIITAKVEWTTAEEEYQYHKNLYEKLLQEEKMNEWRKKEKEYPTACYIWKYFKDLNYNNYVIAGILGNMMAETGGQTLDIQYKIYSSNKKYYGICQWNVEYYKEVKNASLKEQCEFLCNNIEYEINTFGYKYQENFKFEDFLSLEDAEQAALAFAKSYERCEASSHAQRAQNALVAYEYFKGI